MNERREQMGERQELLIRRQNIEAEVCSHRDSIRAALSPVEDAVEIKGEYVMHLAIALNELLIERKGVNRKIATLEEMLGL